MGNGSLWHKDVIPAAIVTAIEILLKSSVASFYLAGGTALALRKIAAIAGRGCRRDFVDLYAIAQPHTLARLLDLFKKKYVQVNYNVIHVLKSLTYFVDAEKEPMPDIRTSLSWDQVTEFFRRETPKLI
jgi:hypothetical protein